MAYYHIAFLHFVLLTLSCSQIATLIAVYANWAFAAIKGIGWGWAGVIWLYNVVFYFPLDIIKFLTRYALSGRAWDLVLEQRVGTHPLANIQLCLANIQLTVC
jgi:hypothetical protein